MWLERFKVFTRTSIWRFTLIFTFIVLLICSSILALVYQFTVGEQKRQIAQQVTIAAQGFADLSNSSSMIETDFQTAIQQRIDRSGAIILVLRSDDKVIGNLSSLPKPKGPGRNWTVAEIIALENLGNKGNVENGKKMYQAVLCASCHTVNGEGASVGPDLTQVSTRFSNKDIAEALVHPSKTVSDQYEAFDIETKDEKNYWGRVISETKDTLVVNTNPLNADQKVKIPTEKIASKKVSKNSIMMPALLNRLNEQEVKDLFYFLHQQAK